MAMSELPSFPQFKPIELEDYTIFAERLHAYRPETSEMTFTNFFVWRNHYNFQWSLYEEWIVVLGRENGGATYAMQPLGPGPRNEVVAMILSWLREEEKNPAPSMERVDARLAGEIAGSPGLSIEAIRDHFDYVYLKEDLTRLAGNKYRTKRNHINKLMRTHVFEYAPLEEKHLEACLDLQSKWCSMRRCDEDLSLLGEWEAIKEITANFTPLKLQGGVVMVEGRVEAFTVGELLNPDTAVIHIEKANPEIGELYTVINQQFAENGWEGILYINREQDLGLPGLREAKLSYQPHHMVEKFRITLA
ncbi:MAG TPA: phosphatidylglycerol lysyltransferase domain-containing protein [Syntrophorhabdaceae bacterium]|jgi:hypothetical protein